MNESERISRFHVLWGRVSNDRPPGSWAMLDARYGDPQRHYHNWSHIDAMLESLLVASREPEFSNVRFNDVEMAIWFHDVVYDPLADDNERRSAEFLREFAGIDSNSEWGKRISQMIEATARHAATEDLSTRLLLDIDLQILGSSPEDYRDYVSAVRAEYAAVPDDIWRVRRPQVMEAFLGRRNIFQTSYFHDRCEARARKNILAEIDACSR